MQWGVWSFQFDSGAGNGRRWSFGRCNRSEDDRAACLLTGAEFQGASRSAAYSTPSTANGTWRMPGVLAGACGSPPPPEGA
jgi:hypothetical protein